MENEQACILVIFGGTGDLTQRKLIPAIYSLAHQKMLPSSFAVVITGRQEKTDEELRGKAYESVKMFSRFQPEQENWNDLSQRIFYRKMDYEEDESYQGLDAYLNELDQHYGTRGNRIYYLAVAPEHFGPIVQRLGANGMSGRKGMWRRIAIEKPFGHDLVSARRLNEKITEVFPERDLFRIDHYLGKEMVQSIWSVRFTNVLFEPLWNSRYIDSIQITSSETIGVGKRGAYYDKTGATRDMVQNHMLQLLALIAMEPSMTNDPEAVRDEKVKLLSKVEGWGGQFSAGNMVLGQYGAGYAEGHEVPAYREEQGVSPDSTTETFSAFKFQIRNPRWEGTPFYIRTGKRLKEKTTGIVVQLKNNPAIFMPDQERELKPNLMVIQIQPKEEIFLQFNTKKPGIRGKICPVKMNFCQNCKICQVEANSPEAYEKLLFDIIAGDSTLFTRWDEVEQSWLLLEGMDAAKEELKRDFPNYLPGTWGPPEAEKMLAADGRQWWNI